MKNTNEEKSYQIYYKSIIDTLKILIIIIIIIIII